MLKYLWTVTQDLLLTVTLITLMHAVLYRLYGIKGRRAHWIGIGAGLVAAAALAIVKNTTKLIISSHWNHYIFGFMLGFMLAFLILSLIFGRKENAPWGVGGALTCVAGAGLTAILIFYAAPGVMAYPYNFNTMGNGYLSAQFFERLAGWAAALLLLLIYVHALHRCALHWKGFGWLLAALNAGSIAYGVYALGMFFAPWITRAKWLKWPVKFSVAEFGWVQKYSLFVSRHSLLFTWIVLALAAVVAVGRILQSARVTDPYDNPAQLRKLRARNRKFRRTAGLALACLGIAAVVITFVKAYDTRVIELSPPETYAIEGDQVMVPLEQFEDGHLHRFEYTTEKNIAVRWIVIKKPGSGTYGVGLDACEVCGNAGYFERNGQVVCKRCDVVMNINTIGFRGGCNPIPLSYRIENGQMVFNMADILAGEKEFR